MLSCRGIPQQATHFLCRFCSQSLYSVRHFLRWLPYTWTDESQSINNAAANNFWLSWRCLEWCKNTKHTLAGGGAGAPVYDRASLNKNNAVYCVCAIYATRRRLQCVKMIKLHAPHNAMYPLTYFESLLRHVDHLNIILHDFTI